MRGPEGQEFSNTGCYLEVVEKASASPGDSFLMTAVISLQSIGKGTKYTALVIHGDSSKGTCKGDRVLLAAPQSLRGTAR